MTGVNIIDFLKNLKDPLFVDSGCGEGRAVLQLVEKINNATCIAIAPNIPKIAHPRISVIAGWAPSFNLALAKKAHFIADIFGGFSYAVKRPPLMSVDEKTLWPVPHEVMIRGGLCLERDGGEMIACSEPGRLGNEAQL